MMICLYNDAITRCMSCMYLMRSYFANKYTVKLALKFLAGTFPLRLNRLNLRLNQTQNGHIKSALKPQNAITGIPLWSLMRDHFLISLLLA